MDAILDGLETDWGLSLILWLQAWRTPLVAALGLLFHVIGSQVCLIPLILIVYWCVDSRLGKRLMLFFIFTGWINALFKDMWQRPRPYHISAAVRNVIAEWGYGLPSGHSQNAAVAGGVAANELRRWWMTLAGVAYAVLTGVSRMVLGVHYPQDVGAGIALGLALLGLYAVMEPPISGWVRRRSFGYQIVAVIAATAAMLMIHPILIAPTSPPWLESALPITDLISARAAPVGVFLGAGVGLALEARYVRFDTRGPLRQQIARVLVGAAGIGALYLALRALQPAWLVGTLRFAALGLWVTFGAAWVYLKIGLAHRMHARDPYAEE